VAASISAWVAPLTWARLISIGKGAGPSSQWGGTGPMCRQLSSQEGVLFSECRWRSVYVRFRIPDSSSPPPM